MYNNLREIKENKITHNAYTPTIYSVNSSDTIGSFVLHKFIYFLINFISIASVSVGGCEQC